MSRGHGLLLCALPALSTFLSPPETRAPAVPSGALLVEAGDPGVSALFSWGDADGDGRLDLAAVSADGRLQLLRGTGDGRFEDVSERVGLANLAHATLALWADYDADGQLDLFVGVRAGASRLFHNDGETFTELGAERGLALEGCVQSARWLDHDADGRLDLFVVSAEETMFTSRLYRGLAGGYFERVELPLADGPALADPDLAGATPSEEVGAGRTASSAPVASAGTGRPSVRSTLERARSPGGPPNGTLALGSSRTISPVGPLVTPARARALVDQAKPDASLSASSLPVLGKLYPLSGNLFVAAAGNVGIGTTLPSAKLHVAGTAKVTDKLTLAPSGDIALDVSTGSIYKANTLFLHTRGGTGNTGLGRQALMSVTSGEGNTASGSQALLANTSGSYNTASGDGALASNKTGDGNSASGAFALFANTSGAFNTASGYGALYKNTEGESNTAVGDSALFYNTTGSNNTASGARGLANNTSGNYNTASGYSALFSNTTGNGNTATGANALAYNTTGNYNTALGDSALFYSTTGAGNTALGASVLASNTTGSYNTASGDSALISNTTGKNNSAGGFQALFSNATGNGNTASGRKALYSNTAGANNTALGNAALFYNTTGSSNIALGAAAGLYVTTGSANITIGNYGLPGDTATTRIGSLQTRTFIAGIRGAATGVANAIPVLIDSAGQLGTTFSSRRFKEDIRDMGDATARLLELRPVLFRYKQAQTLPGGQELPPEYGLIAEEVAEILPDLVVYDDEGQPLTVKYHLLSAMLLNELKQLETRLAVLEARSSDPR